MANSSPLTLYVLQTNTPLFLYVADSLQTKILQDALAECGWESAAQLIQQDTSEAFTFITGKLELPLLTLKMDLYHTGKEEPDDDHRFVNERLLEVAILGEPVEGSDVITLEDCLENYFNNRIDVRRHMERHRSMILRSTKSADGLPPAEEKLHALHVETVEYGEGEVAEMTESPLTEVPGTPSKSPLDRIRPDMQRSRANSIFSQRRVIPAVDSKSNQISDSKDPEHQRKASIRTEVLMPAWQFFKLLPWYTDNVPTSDAQVAAHFSHKRPVLGIALKRYQVSNQGVASRLNTYVDIPLEIAVPAFVSDDDISDDSPLVGNFKLVLQSVVCHRGSTVNSGHYISLVRGQAANAKDRGSFSSTSESPYSDDEPDPWMLFDDLAKDRITYVDIHQKLKEECPYLLFYQVQPIDDAPPTYEESCSRVPSDDLSASPEKLKMLGSFTEADQNDLTDTVIVEDETGTSPNGAPAASIEAVDWETSTRTSLDLNTVSGGGRGRQAPEDARGRTSMSSNRSSAGADALGSHINASVPSTPLDETRSSFLGLPISRRGSKVHPGKSKSRPSSQGAEERSSRFGMSFNMTKITSLGRSPSRNDLVSMGGTSNDEAVASAVTTPGAELTEDASTLAVVDNPQEKEGGQIASTDSVAGSIGSLGGGNLTGGSTESLSSSSRPDNNTFAVAAAAAEISSDELQARQQRTKNWKGKMEQKAVERTRIREEKQKERRDEKMAVKKGKKANKANSKGDVPDRECVVM